MFSPFAIHLAHLLDAPSLLRITACVEHVARQQKISLVAEEKKILDEETRKTSPNQSITAELLIFRVHDIFIISCTNTSTEQIHRTRRRGAIGCDGFKWSCIGFKMDLGSTRGLRIDNISLFFFHLSIFHRDFRCFFRLIESVWWFSDAAKSI